MPMASSRRSVSVSTRLTKNDATLATPERSPPAAAKVSRPDWYASTTSP